MIELHVDAEVTESRQVTITLPPEVPTGRVRLTVGVDTVSQAALPRLDVTTNAPVEEGYWFGLMDVEYFPENAG